MKHCLWGIEGYLVIFRRRVIGQFDDAHWAMEFQQIVADSHKGQPVTILSEDCNSTLVVDDKGEESEGELE